MIVRTCASGDCRWRLEEEGEEDEERERERERERKFIDNQTDD